MKKGIISYLIIILSIIISVKIIAYYVTGTPPNGRGSEGLVNEFDGISGLPTPPISSSGDVSKWLPGGNPIPTVGGVAITSDLDYPTSPLNGAYHGITALRMAWKNESQYILLKSDYFENVGCNPTPEPNYSNYDPANAKDWSCYDYVEFYVYVNSTMNGWPEPLYQPVSIFDGTVTFTASRELNVESDKVWNDYFSISLHYLANQTINGHRFDVTNIKSFTIHAPDVGSQDYSQWGIGPSDDTIYIYYDYLTLGADAKPNSPPTNVSISVDTSKGYEAARLSFDAASQTGTHPITAYHIYRSIDGSPYYGIDYIPNTPGAKNYLDEEGNQTSNTVTACYKILSCDNGPGIFPDTGSLTTNKINVTYNEGALEEATEVCVSLAPRPTDTPTPYGTGGITPGVNTNTPTETKTFTPTATPTAYDITSAHVYPNPFNPDKGSKLFHVDNVPNNTEVKIFGLDGSLINEGKYENPNKPFTWNGRNKNGTKVVTGVYYLVLKSSDGKTDVKRIIVCYKCDPVYKKE